MSTAFPASSELGNLAQSARTKQLKTARGILYFVGVLTVVVNAALVYFAENLVDSEIKKELANVRGQGIAIDQDAVDDFRAQAVRSLQVANGIGVFLGFIFIACGALVYKYPVPATITSLVLYIGAAAVYGVIDPTTLAKGLLVKILIVVALFKAVQSALAFESERKQAAAQPTLADTSAMPL
jgi:hypothetical protein